MIKLPICNHFKKKNRGELIQIQRNFHILYCDNKCASIDVKLSSVNKLLQKLNILKTNLEKEKKLEQLVSPYKVFTSFDLWLAISNFQYFSRFLSLARICKYWHRNS